MFVDEEALVEISQNGEVDPDKWTDVRESLLRRLDQVRNLPELQFPFNLFVHF